ncbi:MAG: PIN/TRAM domain-containing protein [Firmicutes bacterium]|nr:PIN/TRAM domain-containing protein [Bacillota bacterium]
MGKMIRQIFAIVGALLGLGLVFQNLALLESQSVIYHMSSHPAVILLVTGFVIGGVLGYVFGPALWTWATKTLEWAERRLQKMPTQDLLSGFLGLVAGLLIAALISSVFAGWGILATAARVVVMAVAGYLGIKISLLKKDDLLRPANWMPRAKHKHAAPDAAKPKILDTSVIIDGRIADICQTGFLEGTLVVPRFVLDELRHIADSADVLKRNRGRRGLDILNHIQKDLKMPVQIYEREVDASLEVDARLLKLAQMMDGKVVTNDFNLNKVAEFQGVPVLNINELANAVKPVVLPGEEMVVHVVKDGKESGQGIGYLDDGTMIVVDGGRKVIGQTVSVMVTSVLQTAAGRMIFAKMKTLAGVEASEA